MSLLNDILRQYSAKKDSCFRIKIYSYVELQVRRRSTVCLGNKFKLIDSILKWLLRTYWRKSVEYSRMFSLILLFLNQTK
jgi:hypothetical protein